MGYLNPDKDGLVPTDARYNHKPRAPGKPGGVELKTNTWNEVFTKNKN